MMSMQSIKLTGPVVEQALTHDCERKRGQSSSVYKHDMAVAFVSTLLSRGSMSVNDQLIISR